MTLILKSPKIGTRLDFNSRISYVEDPYFVLRVNAILASGYVVYERVGVKDGKQTYARRPKGELVFFKTLAGAKDYIRRLKPTLEAAL